jgi:hypothetical protein
VAGARWGRNHSRRSGLRRLLREVRRGGDIPDRADRRGRWSREHGHPGGRGSGLADRLARRLVRLR